MDSLSQIALGAAVSVAAFRKPIRDKQLKLWQAAAAVLSLVPCLIWMY